MDASVSFATCVKLVGKNNVKKTSLPIARGRDLPERAQGTAAAENTLGHQLSQAPCASLCGNCNQYVYDLFRDSWLHVGHLADTLNLGLHANSYELWLTLCKPEISVEHTLERFQLCTSLYPLSLAQRQRAKKSTKWDHGNVFRILFRLCG